LNPEVWRRIRGDWQSGYRWPAAEGNLVTDVGGNLLGALQQEGIAWLPLLRTNRTNLHPVFFGVYGVYGDPVYHHGAGSRPLLTRADGTDGMTPEAQRQVLQRNRVRSQRILGQIGQDSGFHRQFMA